MSRGIPAGLIAQLNAGHSDDPLLVLLTVEHDDLGGTIRLVANDEDVTSGGDVYTAFAFEATWEQDKEGELPQATVRFVNVSREVTLQLRALTGAPTATLEIVRASAPSTIVASAEYQLVSASWDVIEGTAELAPEPMLSDEYGLSYTPTLAPALFDRQIG